MFKILLASGLIHHTVFGRVMDCEVEGEGSSGQRKSLACSNLFFYFFLKYF